MLYIATSISRMLSENFAPLDLPYGTKKERLVKFMNGSLFKKFSYIFSLTFDFCCFIVQKDFHPFIRILLSMLVRTKTINMHHQYKTTPSRLQFKTT